MSILRKLRTRYQAYIGNVTMRSPRGDHHDRVVWEKAAGGKYSEVQIANMLNNAYDKGRKEALRGVADHLAEELK